MRKLHKSQAVRLGQMLTKDHQRCSRPGQRLSESRLAASTRGPLQLFFSGQLEETEMRTGTKQIARNPLLSPSPASAEPEPEPEPEPPPPLPGKNHPGNPPTQRTRACTRTRTPPPLPKKNDPVLLRNPNPPPPPERKRPERYGARGTCCITSVEYSREKMVHLKGVCWSAYARLIRYFERS